jgi:hypothetical protein
MPDQYTKHNRHAPRPTCWLAKCVCGRPRQGALGSGCGARARLESRRAALDRTCWQHRQSGPAAHRGLLVPVPSERGGREKIGLARARPSHPQQGKASPCGLASDLTVVIPSHRRPRVSHVPTRPRSRGAGSIRFPRAGRLDSLADSSRFFSTSSSLYFFPSPPPHGHYPQSTTSTTPPLPSSSLPGPTPSRYGATGSSTVSVPRAAASSYTLRGFQVKAAGGVAVGGSGGRGRRKDRGHGTSWSGAREGEAAFNSGGGLSSRIDSCVSRMAQADDVAAPLLQGEDADAEWNSRPRRIALFIEPSPFASVPSSFHPEQSS